MRVPYVAAWFVLAAVAVGNGIVRERTYGKLLPELRAHQLSTLIAALLVWVVTAGWSKFWPIASSAEAWSTGAAWLVMTVCFEFGFGRFVAGHAWAKLLADYNLFAGRVWGLFLAWLFVVPYVCYAAERHAS